MIVGPTRAAYERAKPNTPYYCINFESPQIYFKLYN